MIFIEVFKFVLGIMLLAGVFALGLSICCTVAWLKDNYDKREVRTITFFIVFCLIAGIFAVMFLTSRDPVVYTQIVG